MINKLAALAMCFALAGQVCLGQVAAYKPKKLTGEQATRDMMLMRQALESVHPGLTRYTSEAEMSSAFAQLERFASTARTDVELYREISLLLAKIRCDHTKAEQPPAMTDFRNADATHFPFRFRMFDGRMYVSYSDPAQTELGKGTEIVAINGKSISQITSTIYPAISVDGWTDHVEPFKFAADSDLMGADLDHFYPFFFDFPQSFSLVVRFPGSRRTNKILLRPITFEKWKKLMPDSEIDDFSDPRAVDFKMLTSTTAYLDIRTFINYRTPIDAAAKFEPIFAKLRSQKIEHLILDLRSNGGGSDDVPASLASFLITEPVKITSRSAVKNTKFDPKLVSALETWDRSIFDLNADEFSKNSDGLFERKPEVFDLEPANNAFKGRLTVLTSSYNASGVVIALARLRDIRSLTLVGEETGGSAEGPTAGIIVFLPLPESGIRIRIPVIRSYTGVRSFENGKGLVPDMAAYETLSDFMSGNDKALATALKLQ